ncbi:SDR family NAD(P)-dependent oxidoreductase [Nocardia sp. NPDC056064]|uniref:SDR family NAD(P)-dependent oxidoreductase n=1 Tax=Nocardia sp. NPDC056064 TaxID=3345701 RepID=UPI0035DC5F35
MTAQANSSTGPAGRRVVITGGGRGLGRVIAEDLLRHGARVVIIGRAAPSWVADEPDAHAAVADVTDADQLAVAFTEAARWLDGVDVVFANAGVSKPGPLALTAPADFTTVLETNVTGTFLTLQAAVPHLEKGTDARFIALSSALAGRIAPGAGAYSISKAAIETLVRVAAIELAGQSISVNALSPGFIDEGMGRGLIAHRQVWDRYLPTIAAGRPGRGDEVAAVARFLASPESGYINGHVLEVNGGLAF